MDLEEASHIEGHIGEPRHAQGWTKRRPGRAHGGPASAKLQEGSLKSSSGGRCQQPPPSAIFNTILDSFHLILICCYLVLYGFHMIVYGFLYVFLLFLHDFIVILDDFTLFYLSLCQKIIGKLKKICKILKEMVLLDLFTKL